MTVANNKRFLVDEAVLVGFVPSLTHERVEAARECTGVVWPDALADNSGVLSEVGGCCSVIEQVELIDWSGLMTDSLYCGRSKSR